MPRRGTASLTRGQLAEFVGAGTKALTLIADRLGPDLALNWACNGWAMERAFLSVLMPQEEVEPTFKYDKRENGWTLLEDIEFSPIKPTELEFVSFQKPGESYINGEEMVRRARTELRANLGQRHAEYLLKHQQEIPVEFRKCYLVFTGTVWRSLDGNRSIACLDWCSGQWALDFYRLGGDWSSRGRLVRPRE